MRPVCSSFFTATTESGPSCSSEPLPLPLPPFHPFQLLTDLVHARLRITCRGLNRRCAMLGDMTQVHCQLPVIQSCLFLSTTLLVSPRTKNFDLFGSISHKTTSWKSRISTCRWQAGRLSCRAGGKSRPRDRIGLNLLPQRLEHEKGVGQHHQGQMAMQAIPTAPLKVIEAAFALD